MIRTAALASGLAVVTEEMRDARSVCLGFFVGTGSRDEPEESAGASHFLEHLLFKGSERWSASAIAEAVDEVGGEFNAYTSKEYTSFYMRLLAENVDLGLDILGEVLSRPALRAADVDAERHVILDELHMHADEPADVAGEQCAAALFPDHPLGREVIGSERSVSDTTEASVRAFFQTHYRPANMVAAVAGAFDHDAVVAGIDARLTASGGVRPTRSAPSKAVVPVCVAERSTEQAHLVLGIRSLDRFDERRYAAAVFNHALGGGVSSRLFQEIRERRGLAYSVWSERASFADTGMLTVGLGTSVDNVDEVLAVAGGILEELGDSGITGRELDVARGGLRAELLLAEEDSGARMHRIGSSLLLHGEVLEVQEVIERIGAVGADDVAAIAAELTTAPRVLSAVGPFSPDRFDPDRLGLVPAG